MIRRLTIFLGPARLRALFLLLAATGLLNLLLNTGDAPWIPAAQSIVVLVFLLGALLIVGSRLEAFERGRLIGLAIPALVAVAMGLFFVPQWAWLFAGLAAGWVVAGLFIFRPRGPMAYQKAVKLMRKSEYAEAVKAMDELIKQEPENPSHYRFRAEILRLWGKLDRARRDYETMARIDPDSAVAYNGLAEVLLQKGDYVAARSAAQNALERAPGEWVALYNLGMIEDRLGEAADAVEHLKAALAAKVRDARHRLLIHLYLVRAHVRLGNMDAASAALDDLKKLSSGLQEWQTIIDSPQAGTLRSVIGGDIDTARALIHGDMALSDLTAAEAR